MEERELNALGWECPKPIIEAKKLLDGMETGQVTVLVDNPLALHNLQAFAKEKGFGFAYEEEEKRFVIRLRKEAAALAAENSLRPVIVVTGDRFGKGSEELAANLMKSYIYALTEVNPKPQTLIFINAGIFLACEESPVLDSLQLLKTQGVEIFSCGACLNFYGMTERLAVGKVGNMYQFVEKMNNAANCIQL